jgi:hypothetical protein
MVSSKIESVLFNTKKWNLDDALSWSKSHGFYPKVQKVTKDFIHLTINSGYYKRIRTKAIPRTGIELRIGFV